MSRQKIARTALAGALIAESLASMARFGDRKVLYGQALQRARETSRPLVVVGDPDAGAHTRLLRAYGCGDVTIDLAGAPNCPVSIPADITAGPITRVPDDSAVVYVSCVLEYVTNPQAGWREILRMAGRPDNVFMVVVQSWTMTATLYPGARYLIQRAPGSAIMTATPVTATRKALYGGGLVALAGTSI